MKYAFILQHQNRSSVQPMCRLLSVSRSGYYAWLERPPSQRSVEDARLLGLIRESYEASGHTYGAPRILCDLREVGERIGKNRVAKIMKRNKIRAQRGYKQPGVGWSMKTTLAKEIVLDALLMAVWRRKPKHNVIIHSDQGSQFSSDEWNRFCQTHGLVPSMSRRGNCYDNAAVESFFSSMKKEKIRRHIFKTREAARAEIFDYIEVFYNRARRHQHLGNVCPVDPPRQNSCH